MGLNHFYKWNGYRIKPLLQMKRVMELNHLSNET